MDAAAAHQITLLLTESNNGNQQALERLMPLVYDDLRRMARNYLRRQPAGHSFQTTELIHEAYLKLAKNDGNAWQNREHFFGIASKAMRHILVDYARSKHSQRRGAGQPMISLDSGISASDERSEQLVALDDALNDLELLDERKSRVVELRFFGGLTNEEVADVLKISPVTVKREWRFARNWLLRELSAAA